MVVVPNGYGASSGWPSLRTPATVTLEQLSAVVGVPGSTLAAGTSGMLPRAVLSGGHVIVGAVLSTTVHDGPAATVTSRHCATGRRSGVTAMPSGPLSPAMSATIVLLAVSIAETVLLLKFAA